MSTPAPVSLMGKTVIVTGAAGGIGRRYARAVAQAGAHVVIGDVDVPGGADAERALQREGLDVRFVELDQASDDSVEAFVADACSQSGRVDALVNNAAMFSGLARKPLLDITPDEWRTVIDVNLTGVFLLCRAVLPSMIRHGAGRIVNIGSSSVFRASNNLGHYVSAKIGVVGLTRTIAREYGAHGITANCLSPGVTDSGAALSTEQYVTAHVANRSIPRVERPEDLVGTLLYLLSPASDFVTGQHLIVDGGNIFS